MSCERRVASNHDSMAGSSLVTHRSRLNSQRRRDSLPIWSCSVWGLPCPSHYWSGGALLPHLFTLTLAGGMFSVALSVSRLLNQLPGRYPAHCSLEFGLSSRHFPQDA